MKFKSLATALAALLASTSSAGAQDAVNISVEQELKDLQDKGPVITIRRPAVNTEVFDLQHRSHSSHRSHMSHRSHSSHASHYSGSIA